MIKNANSDLWAGCIGLALSVAFWFSIDEEIMRLSIMFPKAMIAIMALISILLLVKGVLKAERQDLFNVGSNKRVHHNRSVIFRLGGCHQLPGLFRIQCSGDFGPGVVPGPGAAQSDAAYAGVLAVCCGR